MEKGNDITYLQGGVMDPADTINKLKASIIERTNGFATIGKAMINGNDKNNIKKINNIKEKI